MWIRCKPTSRNSSRRFLWLEPIPSSQSCWWALISQYLSPTSPYRPWCLPLGWSTKQQVNIWKQTDMSQNNTMHKKEGKKHAATNNLPANQCQETASHQHQLAGLALLAGCCWILPGLLQRLLGGHHPVSDAISPDCR